MRARRRPDGGWDLDDTFNGRFQVSIEAKGQPSRWVTLHALLALKAAEGGLTG